jgi:hypothetical protein
VVDVDLSIHDGRRLIAGLSLHCGDSKFRLRAPLDDCFSHFRHIRGAYEVRPRIARLLASRPAHRMQDRPRIADRPAMDDVHIRRLCLPELLVASGDLHDCGVAGNASRAVSSNRHVELATLTVAFRGLPDSIGGSQNAADWPTRYSHTTARVADMSWRKPPSQPPDYGARSGTLHCRAALHAARAVSFRCITCDPSRPMAAVPGPETMRMRKTKRSRAALLGSKALRAQSAQLERAARRVLAQSPRNARNQKD